MFSLQSCNGDTIKCQDSCISSCTWMKGCKMQLEKSYKTKLSYTEVIECEALKQ